MSTANGQGSMPEKRPPLALRWRLLISVVILLHLAAVLAAPLAVPPASEVEQSLVEAFRPYVLATYLDHGYRFFAPAPGASHLVQYTLEMPDGSSKTGRFPDVKTEWPRLFYHRYFMLSEHLNQFFPMLPPDAPPEAVKEVQQKAMPLFEEIAQSYAQYLLRVNGATRVKLELIGHSFPELKQFVDEQRNLSDPRSYTVLWERTYEPETL